ncbi:MAG: hypothetical protein IJ192_05490 [Clostridia bacterium]|nr:hypothetical protein [Clostridia bacterium]
MIRAKLVLRNVINKPLRTAIIILSLAAAAFAALFCISGIHSAQNSLRDFFQSNYGDVDIMISSDNNKVDLQESDFPSGSRLIGQALGSVNMTLPNTKYFNYVNKTTVSVIGIDTELAYELRLTDAAFPTENGITITEPLARQYDKKVGDTFTFYGDGGTEYDLKILAVAAPTRFLKPTSMAVIVTPELCNQISGDEKGTFNMMFVDVPDEQVDQTTATLLQKHPEYYYFATTSDDSNDAMNSMLNIYYLIFAIVFLMVCFIVVSMSKHIINERMSVIGMLRSIGGSIKGTGLLLLAESAFYGLCGGILGSLLFLPFRGITDLGMFAAAGEEEITKSDGINFLTVCLVILAVILLQCIFSAAAIMKAAKTPVRDIIFGTKETVYIPSKPFSIFGIVLLVLGLAAYFFFDDFTMTVIAAFCSAVGAVMLFPMLVKLLSDGLAVLFGKWKMPVARLAVKEIASTKSNISSAQLILSAISLTIAILTLASSLIIFMSQPYYDAELLITMPEQDGSQYDYLAENIDGVQDVEKLYYKFLEYDTKAEVNGTERDLTVMSYENGGFRHFSGITDCPEILAENEIAVDKTLASKLSLKIGDEMTLKLKLESYLPRELKLKIKCFIDSSRFNNMNNTVLINTDTYKSVYFDQPAMVLVKTEPGKEFYVLDILQSTLADDPAFIRTTAEYWGEAVSSMDSIMTIIYAIVVLGLALSLMGTSSNILMGFEQSRRKYAVYYSTAMSKDQLKKLIISETLLTSGISVVAAVIFGMYFLQIITKALSQLHMSVPLIQPLLYAVIFGAGAFVILTVVIMKPLKMLSKMNIAEEIKTNAD